MNSEILWLICVDTIWGNLAINNAEEIMIESVKNFHNTNIAFTLAAIGGVIIASLFNYFFGKIIFKILYPESAHERAIVDANISKVQTLKILPLLLALTFIPFWGKFIILFAGVCALPLKRVLPITVITKLIYYICL